MMMYEYNVKVVKVIEKKDDDTPIEPKKVTPKVEKKSKPNGKVQEQSKKVETKSLSEAIEKVEEACKSDNKEDIDKSVEELSKVAQPLSDKLFKKEAAQQPDGEATEKEDDAVDADFKEVDEEKDK